MSDDPVDQPEARRGRPLRAPRGPDDYELIAALGGPDRRASADSAGSQLYDALELTPYQVVYEELSSPDGYEPTIRGVLAHLGLA